MIEVSLKEFRKGNINDARYHIYVLKLDGFVLYVGRALDIYARWFGFNGHMSYVGKFSRMVTRNPRWKFTIQLWTPKEAADYCGYHLTQDDHPYDHIEEIEYEMIQKLKPSENHTSADYDQPAIPRRLKMYKNKSEIELDNIYKDIRK